MRPQSARLTIDTEMFGKMDPYCKIQVGGNTQQTKVAHNAGKTPVWSDVMTYRLNNDSQMTITLYDKDHLTKDDLLGTVVIPLDEIYTRKTITNNYELRRDGKVTGQVNVTMEFSPEGSGAATGGAQAGTSWGTGATTGAQTGGWSNQGTGATTGTTTGGWSNRRHRRYQGTGATTGAQTGGWSAIKALEPPPELKPEAGVPKALEPPLELKPEAGVQSRHRSHHWSSNRRLE